MTGYSLPPGIDARGRTPREWAEHRLAEALMNAYNETVGGKLDEYPDGKHFLRAARIAIDRAVVPVIVQDRGDKVQALIDAGVEFVEPQPLDEAIPWDAVCAEESKP